MLKVIVGFPPNIEDIKKVVSLKGGELFCYNPFLYNPSDSSIDKPLIAHELIHAAQQKDNPKEWWQRYLVDKDFRLAMEIPAYQTQYKAAKSMSKDRNSLFQYAHLLAKDLSGSMYGEIINYQEALEAIKLNKLIQFKI